MRITFTGSDVILLNTFPKELSIDKLAYVENYRVLIRTAMSFIEGWDVVHEHLIPELNQFGIVENIKVIPPPFEHCIKYPKIKHRHFNILYYCPQGADYAWNKWIYGYDVWERVQEHFRGGNVRFFGAYGQYDMKETYPITDFYLRCNRHDGYPRMVLECEVQKIPYYWSYEKPDFDEIIKQIESCLR